ncbi:MAG TPA: hypothetical protein VLS90_11580 [Thermodesulfobacteriota bacterium]|nr:hypothetical protein [Thermodesulfobacteriota bacterium]
MNIRTYLPNPLLYFLVPFVLVSAFSVWTSYRISRPDAALAAVREYLNEKVPGGNWQVSKVTKLGAGLDKKWRIELAASTNDGRTGQANLVVDRWRPGRLVGRFVILLAPPQILDGGWESPSRLGLLSRRIPGGVYIAASGAAFLIAQCLLLWAAGRRKTFLPRDGLILAVLGAGVLGSQLVLEIHPGYLAAYAGVLCFVVGTVFFRIGGQHA